MATTATDADPIVFTKLDSDIPSCCRLTIEPPPLDIDRALAELPEEIDNPKPGRIVRREKWILLKPGSEDSSILDRWPEMRDFIESFPGRCLYAHVARMQPGARLDVHRDGYDPKGNIKNFHKIFDQTLRFHVPLRTSADVHIYSDGRLYTMKVGEIWMLNNMKDHAVANDDAAIDRYHLIIDVEPNAETMTLIDEADPDLGRNDAALFDRLWPGEQMR